MENNSRRDFLKLSALPLLTPVFKQGNIHLKKKPVIVLRSSWNDNNIGDIGHTPGTLRILETHLPEAEIMLWHAQPRPVTEALSAGISRK